MNDNSLVYDLLKATQEKYRLPAMACALVTSNGQITANAIGTRKRGEIIPVTSNDVWHLGSNTKAMTAFLIGVLIDDGRLSLDQSIEQTFPYVAPSLPAWLRCATLLHLLSHRAGLPENVPWRKMATLNSRHEERLAVLKSLSNLKSPAELGGKYVYSNVGYVIAAAMVEEIMEQLWETLIAKRVFLPLLMNTAGFGGTGTPGQLDQPWPHFANGTPAPNNGPSIDNPPVMAPAGMVHCSILDWGRFVTDLLRGLKSMPATLRPHTYGALYDPAFRGNYSSGWIVLRHPWGISYAHSGSNTMNYSTAFMVPKKDIAVLVCTNQGGSEAAAACNEIVKRLITLR